MPIIASGASATITILKGYLLALAAGAQGSVSFGPGPQGSQTLPLVGQAMALGPFAGDQVVYVNSSSGQLAYSLQRADNLIPSKVPSSPYQMSPLILEQSHVSVAALTGTTTLTTLASILVPAGLMGANGSLRISAAASITNNVNTKSLAFSLGGVAFFTSTATSSAALQQTAIIANRGSLASQIARLYGPNGGGSENTGAVNTAIDQILTISGQLGVGTDSLTLDSYLVELLPG